MTALDGSKLCGGGDDTPGSGINIVSREKFGSTYAKFQGRKNWKNRVLG